jgi:D-arabinose 5-phosphate isomerase GutQ
VSTVPSQETLFAAARRAYEIEQDAVGKAFAAVDETAFLDAVAALSRAPRIAASGCGHSGIACRHFAHLMCCIERPARFLSPSEATHGASGYLQPGDVLLLVSRGGKTEELLPLLGIAKAKGALVITVTEDETSPLAREADIVLKMAVTRETDRFNSQGTTSFTVQCVLFHALQAAMIEQTDYRNEQFKLIHPGGAVGKRLNGK